MAVFVAGSVIPVGAALKAGEPVSRAFIAGVGKTSVTTAVGVGTNFVVAPIATSLAKSAGIDPIWAKDIGIGTGFATSIFTAGKVYKGGGNGAKVDGGSKSVEDSINGLKVIDSKVGGKIPINEYNELRDLSIHNKSSDSITLGKYRPTINADGTENWKVPGPDSYNTLAKNDGNMYFDMGSAYDEAMKKYNLSYQEMFDYFNVPALDDAATTGKTIRFSHNPELPAYKGSFTELEWKYLQNKYGYLYLREEGGFWYGEK